MRGKKQYTNTVQRCMEIISKTLKAGIMKKYLLSLLLALALVVGPVISVLAATDADVTVTATPAYVAITDNATTYDFGTISASANYTTSTALVAITNTSSVQTDITIGVTTNTWSGGVTWTHSETATAGADTVGLVSNNATFGVSDVIVKYTAPNFIYENCPAGIDFTYGLKLVAPSSFGDGVQKSVIVRITAVAG